MDLEQKKAKGKQDILKIDERVQKIKNEKTNLDEKMTHLEKSNADIIEQKNRFGDPNDSLFSFVNFNFS